jgi:hypothetical protein
VTIDKVTLGADGRAIERVANFDPAPLLRALALTPSAWPRFVKTRLRRGTAR